MSNSTRTRKPATKTTPEAAAQRKAETAAKAAAQTPPTPAPTQTEKPAPTCACGCGETTRGGTYRPGHDAKAKSHALAIVRGETDGDREAALALLAQQRHDHTKAAPKTRECECECGGSTRGGRFLPGHDAKLKGRLLAAAVNGDKAAEKALQDRGWHHFLAASVAKAARKAAPKAAK